MKLWSQGVGSVVSTNFDGVVTGSEETPADFDAFYQREYGGQLRRAYLLLGSSADAKDAVASAFTSVYDRWDRIDAPGPYVNRTVLNECRTIWRRRRRVHAGAHLSQEAGTRSDHSQESTDSVAMAQLLASLPYKQRAVVVLKHYAAMSEREIADALDIAPGSVGPTLHRAHHALRKHLERGQ